MVSRFLSPSGVGVFDGVGASDGSSVGFSVIVVAPIAELMGMVGFVAGVHGRVRSCSA